MASADVTTRADTDTDTPAEKQAAGSSLRKQASTQTQTPYPEPRHSAEEDRRVHEITESSSDESADEVPRRTTSKRKASTMAKVDKDANAASKATTSGSGDATAAEKTSVAPPEEARDPWFFASRSNVADLHYLFTNDKLKEQQPEQVLRKDPFCIPRVTDNVSNYRPALNPLSILMGEEKLLPGYFRLDPSERLPGAGSKVDGGVAGASTAQKDRRCALPTPAASTSVASTNAGTFRGKTSAFMGTMPRQSEFAEIPVSEKLFQDHQVLRPPAPSSLVATAASAPFNSAYQAEVKPVSTATAAPSSSSSFVSGRDGDQNTATSTTGAKYSVSSLDASTSSASVSDAMLLSSIQRTLDSNGGGGGDNTASWEGGADYSTSMHNSCSSTLGGQLQPMDSIADTLTHYLPTRSPSTTDDQRLMGGHYFDAPHSMHSSCGSMATGNGNLQSSSGAMASATFGSLLSPPQAQPNGNNMPYAGLFEDEQSQTGGSFSSALGSTSLMTPTSFATASSNAASVTPHDNTTGTTSRRQTGAKKPRAKNVFRPCTAPGCTKGARGKSGLCQKHGGGKRCAVEGCTKGAQGSSSMCLFHGGGYRCTVEGCNTGARGTSGLCAKHGGYKRSSKSSGPAGDPKRRRPSLASETSEDPQSAPDIDKAAVLGQ